MANQIQATVYQIDGNPQTQPITNSFLTSNIYIKEASISTNPAVQSAIVCYLNTSNQLQEQTFYVSEDIATLVAAANVGNASQVQVTVLGINGDPQVPGGVQYSFPAAGIAVWEVIGSTAGINSSITFKNKQYGVSETESSITAAANVSSAGVQGAQGIQGPAGPQGPIGPVGPAGLTWQGSWVSGTSYVANDAVGYNGASWFCILATSGTTTPNLDTTHWALLASQGAQGATGATGAQGPTGPQGPQGPAGPSGSGDISTVKVTLSSSDILNLYSTPFQLLPAPGAGKFLNVLRIYFKYNYNGTPYTGGGSITTILDYGLSSTMTVTNPIANVLNSSATSFVRPVMTTTTTVTTLGYDNVGLFLTANANQTLGNGTLDVYITYGTTTL